LGWKCEKERKRHQGCIWKISKFVKVENKNNEGENETVFGRKVYPVYLDSFNIDQIEEFDFFYPRVQPVHNSHH